MPPNRDAEFIIKLAPGTAPVSKWLYQMPPNELVKMKKKIRDLEDKGFIGPISSPWGCPAMFMKNKYKSLTMVVDYHPLNEVTLKNKYPLPRINDLFDQLRNTKVLSKVDLRMGNHRIKIRSEDIPKTMFWSRYGSYEYTWVSFHFTNAPSSFMQLMNSVFMEYIDKFGVVFIEEILIFLKNEKDHILHLKLVHEKLQQHRLYAKFSKYEFWKSTVKKFVHVLSADPAKVIMVQNWQYPRSMT